MEFFRACGGLNIASSSNRVCVCWLRDASILPCRNCVGVPACEWTVAVPLLYGVGIVVILRVEVE